MIAERQDNSLQLDGLKQLAGKLVIWLLFAGKFVEADDVQEVEVIGAHDFQF